MNLFLVFIFLWSLMLGLSHWARAITNIILGFIGEWSLNCFNAIMYSVICIDAFLRIFSPTHTGLW